MSNWTYTDAQVVCCRRENRRTVRVCVCAVEVQSFKCVLGGCREVCVVRVFAGPAVVC